MARLARSSTTTSSVTGSMYATLARPASTASTAPTTAARACVSAGDSSARRSHNSSITSDSTLGRPEVPAKGGSGGMGPQDRGGLGGSSPGRH